MRTITRKLAVCLCLAALTIVVNSSAAAQPAEDVVLQWNRVVYATINIAGQQMRYIGNKSRRTKTGYLQTFRRYKAQNCTGCPLRGPCHKSSGNRIIERSPNLLRIKQRVKELLNSEEGIEKRKQRWQVEAVFGNLKQNKGFRRFNLREIEKTTTEFGLIALAHNLQRLSTNH